MISHTKTPTTGAERLWALFFRHEHKSVREQADMLLFAVGVLVEYVLLVALFQQFASGVPFMLIKLLIYLVMVALCIALAVHQFLIFRNYSLHYSLSRGRLRPLERVICLLFGVLTGELGYLVVLSVCYFSRILRNLATVATCFLTIGGVYFIARAVQYIWVGLRQREFPWRSRAPWLVVLLLVVSGVIFMLALAVDANYFALKVTTTKLEWFFANEAFDVTQGGDRGEVAFAAIKWFTRSLGCALEMVFAVGALILSMLIFAWDGLSGRTFESAGLLDPEEPTDSEHPEGHPISAADAETIASSYRRAKAVFYKMDFLACVTWTAVVGVISPRGLMGIPSNWCGFGLAILGFSYFGSAYDRLRRGRQTLAALSSYDIAKVTVI